MEAGLRPGLSFKQGVEMEDNGMAYSLPPYLLRTRWTDGTEAYCRPCDSPVPLRNVNQELVCPAGHRQHPLTALMNSEGLNR